MSRPLNPEPARDCPLCPRLVAYRQENIRQNPDWWNGPAPSFGEPDLRQEMAEGEQTGQEHDGQQRRFAEGVTEADEQQRHERHGGEGRKQREESFHVRTVGLRTQR